MRLLCQERLLPGETLPQEWESARAIGFDGIELDGSVRLRERLPELRAARQAGIAMPTVCVNGGPFIGDLTREDRRSAIDHMRWLLSIFGGVGGRGGITPAAYGRFSRSLPSRFPPRDEREDRVVLLEALHEVGEHAAREGTLVLLEPLNRYEDHMVNRVEQAVDLCREVGLSSVRVIADLYHMNIEERDPAMALREAAGYLGHVHLSDRYRHQPGAGHLDFASPLRALREIEYDGCLAIKCRLPEDPMVAHRRSVDLIRKAS